MEIRFNNVVVDCMSLRRATGKLAAGGCCRNASTLISISGANGEGHPPKLASNTLALKFDREAATIADVCQVVNFARGAKRGERVLVHSNKGRHRGPAAAIVFLAAAGMPWKEAVEKVLEHFSGCDPDNSVLRHGDRLLHTKMARYVARRVAKRDVYKRKK